MNKHYTRKRTQATLLACGFLSATGVEELLQYTTSPEVAGILGNFTGSTTEGSGESSTGSARRDPEDLLKSGHDAEEKIIGLTRGIGRSGLQKWAEAADEQCESATEESRPKGQHRHGKKTPLVESIR